MQRPNIILILADDLGYGELGCYGQQLIETPNIDKLAENGMLFTQHYSGAPVCAPARCILLTGKHAGHAAIRGNDEWKERGDVWNYEEVYRDPGLEGQRPLPAEEVTMGSLLRGNGYSTAFIGKWGLGAPGSEGTPNNHGFDYFFGYNCQRQAHTLYPGHLWENDERIYLDNPLLAPHQKLDSTANVDAEVTYARYSGNQYAPDLMHMKALDYLTRNAGGPFFMIYASPLPHLPLQAGEEWVDHYRRKIADDPPYDGSSGYFPNYSPRATYAAMISTLDEQVGELVAMIDSLGLTDNTIFLFTSDNGPTYTGGADTEYFDSARPFSSDYGRTKGFLYEGGIRVPFIASWKGRIAPGSRSDHVCAFYDHMSTVADLTGASIPTDIDGLSFLPELLGVEQEEHDHLYWEQPEYGGQMAVRKGKWKGVIRDLHKGNGHLELYDLSVDIQEQTDVSETHPDVADQLARIIKKEHRRAAVAGFRFPVDGRR